MFRSATTRIAHNSTLPSLSTFNKDLKSLQELINAEKNVMHTIQKLSTDVAKAAECQKQWGNGEGDDLGDTLNASTTLLLHFASALARLSAHIAKVREQMKAVRTREENLDEVKRRRKALVSKADAADKKLSKMSADNKNFQSQADSLNKLREEIRGLDTEILNEEASLGDFKRSTAKNWMGTKFGALMECSAKGMIVGEMGKLVIEEIPLTPTEPGLPRPYYQGHARTEFVVTEAQRAIDEVTFSIEPSQRPHSLSIRPLPGSELPPIGTIHGLLDPAAAGGAYSSPSISTTPSIAEAPSDVYKRHSQVYMSPGQQFNSLPPIRQATDESFGMNSYLGTDQRPPSQPGSPPPPTSPHTSHSFASSAIPPVTEVNEFGAYPGASSQFSPRSASLRNLENMNPSLPASPIGGPRGPRFATFPSKSSTPFAPQLQSQPSDRASTYSATQGASGRGPSIELDRRESVSFSSSIAQALGQDWVAAEQETPQSQQPTKINSKLSPINDNAQDQWSPPPPRYTATPEHPSSSAAPSTAQTHLESQEDDDVQLAYVASDIEDRTSRSSAQPSSHGDRHVRFGATSEDEPSYHEQTQGGAPYHSETPSAPQQETAAHLSPPQSPHAPAQTPTSPPTSHVEVSPPSFHEPQHVPPPTTAKEEEERALNAAAAREIAREMDALMFTGVSPPPLTHEQQTPTSPPPSSPRSLVSQGRRSVPEESAASPTLSAREPAFVRQRDRAPSNPVSPTGSSDHSYGAPPPSGPPPTNEIQSPSTDSNQPLPPPPNISLRGASPAHSFNSTESPFRTPSEFPLPPPAPFYMHSAASGSGSLTGGGTRTISAAAFKRQLRSPSSPAVEGSQIPADVSPLNISKRGLPGSPRPSLPAGSVEGGGTPRLSSLDPRNRSVSAAGRPQSIAPSGDQGEEDEYDYISAYTDNSGTSPDGHNGPGGYGQARYATNTERDSIL